MPDDSKHQLANLRSKRPELVFHGKECTRVYWMPVLAQGKLHLEALGSRFPGDHVNGMPAFVHKLRSSLNTRFRSDQKPTTVFVDLGGGFYQGGVITGESKMALRKHGLNAFHGDDASIQPGSSGDVWLYEIAVS